MHRKGPSLPSAASVRLLAGEIPSAWSQLLARRIERLAESCDKQLGECLKAVHATVLKLGGPEFFSRTLMAALRDPEISQDTKAEIALGLMNAWMVCTLMYERTEHVRYDQLSDTELLEKVGAMMRSGASMRERQRKEREREKAGLPKRRGRPPKNPKEGDYHFIGPVHPSRTQPPVHADDQRAPC